MNELKQEIIKMIIENKMVIIMAIGFVCNSALEYYLGEGEHGSLIGFLKYLMKRKNEPKA